MSCEKFVTELVCIPSRPTQNVPAAKINVVRSKKFCKDLPFIVFLSPLLGSTAAWACQQEFFSKHYNTISIDLRGQGYSSKTDPAADYPVGLGQALPTAGYTYTLWAYDVQAVLQQYGVKSAFWLTEDVGGATAYVYESLFAGQIKKLLWIEANVQYVTPSTSLWLFPYFPLSYVQEGGLIYDLIMTNYPGFALLVATADANGTACTDVAKAPVITAIADIILLTPAAIALNISQVALTQDLATVPSFLSSPFPVLITFGGDQTSLDPTNPASGLLTNFAPLNTRGYLQGSASIYEFVKQGYTHQLTDVDRFNKVALEFIRGKNYECDICDE